MTKFKERWLDIEDLLKSEEALYSIEFTDKPNHMNLLKIADVDYCRVELDTRLVKVEFKNGSVLWLDIHKLNQAEVSFIAEHNILTLIDFEPEK